MIKTTRKQREAILHVYNRTSNNVMMAHNPAGLSFKQFRALAQGTFGMDGAIVLPWCNMFLCIETDGYTHS